MLRVNSDQPRWRLDTEKGDAGLSDPLAALEKSTDAQTRLTKVQMPRLESLQSASEHYNSDPYSLSLKVRKRFRAEKKVEKEKQTVDDLIKGRYGLPETLHLVDDDDDVKLEAKEGWQKGRRELGMRRGAKRQRLSLGTTSLPDSSTSKIPHSRPISSGPHSRSGEPNDVVTSLRARILENTSRQSKLSSQGADKNVNARFGVRK
jgi:coiled-coil domain-containing protein 130